MTQARAKAAKTASASPEAQEASADVHKMALRITAKPKLGFRRCGVHHPAEAVEFVQGQFSDAQIKVLKGEPNLVVEEL